MDREGMDKIGGGRRKGGEGSFAKVSAYGAGRPMLGRSVPGAPRWQKTGLMTLQMPQRNMML